MNGFPSELEKASASASVSGSHSVYTVPDIKKDFLSFSVIFRLIYAERNDAIFAFGLNAVKLIRSSYKQDGNRIFTLFFDSFSRGFSLS